MNFGRLSAKIRYYGQTMCKKCSRSIVGKNQRNNIEDIKAEVERHGGTLLTTEYLGNKKPLSILGSCGHAFELSYARIITGRWSQECGEINKRQKKRKYTYEFVRDLVSNLDGELLTKTFYSVDHKLDVRCLKMRWYLAANTLEYNEGILVCVWLAS
jgi:hypothetical protein